MIKRSVETRPVTSYFILALLLSWAVYVPYSANQAGFLPVTIPIELVVLAQYSPLVAAVSVIAIIEGSGGIKQLLKRATIWRVNIFWYGFVIFITPLIGLSILGIHAVFGDNIPASPPDLALILQRFAENIDLSFLRSFATIGVLPAIISFLLLAVMNGGVSEEFGWRGFMLPRLLNARSPFVASLITGAFWGLWHSDTLFWTGIFNGRALSLFVLFGHTLETMAIAVLFTWVFIRTTGSLLLCILFHAAINSTFTIMNYWWHREPAFILYAEFTVGFWIVALLIVSVVDKKSFTSFSEQNS